MKCEHPRKRGATFCPDCGRRVAVIRLKRAVAWAMIAPVLPLLAVIAIPAGVEWLWCWAHDDWSSWERGD